MLVVDAGGRVTYPSKTIWRGQTLKYGSRGTYVKQLQEMLNKAGYNAGKADGIFGKNTKNAVMSFQRANRLAQDGIAGKNTYNALIKNLQNKAKIQAQKNAANNHWSGQTLRIGSRGQAVKDLQNNLKKLGYNVGAVDGIYGKQTASAVKSFQKKYGLSQDGIAGKNTYSAMNQAIQKKNTYNPNSVVETKYKALESKVHNKNSTWDEVSKSLIDIGKAGFDFIIGDDIKTILDPNAKTIDKVVAGLSFIPALKVASGLVKLSKVGGKVALKIDQNKLENIVSGLGKFKGDEAIKHFEKHSKEIMTAMGKKEYNLKNYLEDANHVRYNGQYVSELNGYVKLIGGKGSAKYAFVGLDRRTGHITTFHIKSASYLSRNAPSLGIKK